MVLPENRDVDHVCSLIEKHKVVVLPTSPTFLNLMLMSDAHKRFDMGSLRMITYGTEPMPESLLGRLREAFRGVRFLQTFGTSETGIAQTSSKSSSSTLIKIDDPNTEYRIVEGELWIRSSTQILGYLNYGMDSFTEDGWFMTGDLAEEEGDGYIRIKGRIKEIINVGGLKVLPEEVESMLMEVPGIADCMVYGESTAITGQMVVADVVPAAEEDRREMFKRIRAYCRDRMENYKIPVKINIKSRTNFGSRFKKIRRA